MATTDAAAPFERSVAVIGGGIAGITAAVKLYQQGFDVTIFEKGAQLGGNLSSGSVDNTGVARDIYPHIFGDWYKEFWYLLENDFDLKRDDWFARRDKIRMAMIPADSSSLTGFNKVDFATLATPTSLSNLTDDLFSTILSQRDMFLFGYTYIDLVSVPRLRKPLKVLNELDVTGYLYSRPFVDNEIADFHDDILKVIWSMPTNQTSAKAYQSLIRHTLTFPNETPFAWLMNRPASMLMDEITDRLSKREGKNGERIMVKLGIPVNELILDEADKQVQLRIGQGDTRETQTFRYAVVATPPLDAVELVLPKSTSDSLVTRQPSLALLREAEVGRIPVVYLSFHKDFLAQHQSDLSALPKELTGFRLRPAEGAARGDAKASGKTPRKPLDNDYDISMLDLTGLWNVDPFDPKKDATKPKPDAGPVLVIAASHSTAIQARGPEEDAKTGAKNNGEAQGFAMLKKLQEYLPFFNPGAGWGDPKSSCVNWDRTRVITNSDYKLFLNDVDADRWRPYAKIDNVKNVFFAGDYCRTDVDMATVEAAVQSGVLAAQALQTAAALGNPIQLQAHDLYTTNALLLAKLTSMPAAFVAAATATCEEASADPVSAMELPYTVAVLAIAYWADWLRSVLQFWRGCVPRQDHKSPSGAPAQGDVADHDRQIGVAGLLFRMGLALVVEGPTVAPRLADGAAAAAYSAWYWAIGRLLYPGLPKKLREPVRQVAAPSTGARTSGDRVPSTWSDLLPGSITPRDLSATAFGAAAGAVRLFETLADPKKISPPRRSPQTFSPHLRDAVVAGAEAHARNLAAYRHYPVVNSVRPEQR
jgi:uncharacterized protein with NAD-binding domain and iron-sulfur cluster